MMLRTCVASGLAIVLCLALTCGCGGENEDDARAARLASDPPGSFEDACDAFLAGLADQVGLSVVGSPKRHLEPMTEAFAGSSYYEGGHVGFLLVTLADKDKKETPFRFAFLSVSAYGTWMLKKIHAKEPGASKYDTYGGDHDAIYQVATKVAGY